MENMKIQELQSLGLTKSEAKVYTTLLKIGISSTGKIVKEAKISSGKIYEVLDKLMAKGLVTYVIKKSVKYFSAADPIKIEEYWQQKKNEFIKQEQTLQTLIPDLRELKKVSKEYSAEIYQGFDGFRTALLSLPEGLPKKSEILLLGGSGIREPRITIVWEQLCNICEKKNIQLRFVVTDTSQKSKKQLKHYQSLWKHFHFKFLPGFHLAPIVVSPAQIIIINIAELSAIVIKSSTVANQFKFFFESMWRIAKVKP